MQSDEPEEPKKPRKKDRKGKKDRSKKKRDKSSRKKGKKEHRKKRKEGEGPSEDGFLGVSTALPEYLSQEPYQSTVQPDVEPTTAKAVFRGEDIDHAVEIGRAHV